jgi:hypothetical protein
MIGVMTALLPAEFWTHIAEPAGRRLVNFLKRIRGSAKGPPWATDAITRWRRRGLTLGRTLRDGVALLLIVYVVVWNINSVPGRQGIMPATYRWIAADTGLDQLFSFFAPDPGTHDGWLVIEGDLENGKTVNAFTGEPTVRKACQGLRCLRRSALERISALHHLGGLLSASPAVLRVPWPKMEPNPQRSGAYGDDPHHLHARVCRS